MSEAMRLPCGIGQRENTKRDAYFARLDIFRSGRVAAPAGQPRDLEVVVAYRVEDLHLGTSTEGEVRLRVHPAEEARAVIYRARRIARRRFGGAFPTGRHLWRVRSIREVSCG